MSESSPPDVKRSGGLRAEHAALTRRVLLQAARELFARHGYASVSVRQLAAHAGVSVQTIYDTFGSKAGLVRSFADLVEHEAGIRELMNEVASSSDPCQMLAIVARMRRRIRERCGDIERILKEASSEPEVAAAWEEGMRRRHTGQLEMCRQLGAAGALAPGLSAERAADIVAALNAADICDILIDQRGWSLDEYEQWLARTLAAQLLPP